MATKLEYWNSGTNSRTGIGLDGTREGQTFTIGTLTTNADYIISSVKFKLYKINSPGTVTCSLYATSSGLPTGSALSTGTLNGNDFTTDTAGAEYEFSMSSYTMSASTQYAVILTTATNDPNYVAMKWSFTTGTYTGGTAVQYQNPSGPWAETAANSDAWFEVWGFEPVISFQTKLIKFNTV